MLHTIAERRIREAIERGELDNLELAGKPLPLDANPFVPDDLRIAYKVLKDAGFLPPEIELRKEIVTLKELLRDLDEGEDAERVRLARRINERVLRLNLMLRRSFDAEDRQVYARKLRDKFENGTGEAEGDAGSGPRTLSRRS
jgi:hypothetical protein